MLTARPRVEWRRKEIKQERKREMWTRGKERGTLLLGQVLFSQCSASLGGCTYSSVRVVIEYRMVLEQ